MSVGLERREMFRFYEVNSEEKRGIVDKLRKALVRRSEFCWRWFTVSSLGGDL